MRVERFDKGEIERRVLISMIVDTEVLAAIASKWKHDQFTSTHLNTLAEICIRYWKRHKEAPGKSISTLFVQWSRARPRNKEVVAQIESLLAACSDDWVSRKEEVSPKYNIDLASELFRRIDLERLADGVQGCCADSKLDDAEKLLLDHKKQTLAESEATHITQDQDAIWAAFEGMRESLIKFTGARGQFFGGALSKGSFVAITAPEKKGKTWQLIDLAWEAMCQRKRVLFFSVGDMSRDQILPRFLVRAAKKPIQPGIVKYPIDFSVEDGEPTVKFNPINFEDGLTREESWAAMQHIQNKVVKSERSFLDLYCLNSVTMDKIWQIVEEKSFDGWVPDVIVVDYADRITAVNKRQNARDEINEVWMRLRDLSLEFDCLVLTATQGSRKSYYAKYISMDHTSEDKRKQAHVTGMYGLTQTPEEKELGIMKLNWVVLREQPYVENRHLWTAQCLSLGQPCVLATFNEKTKKALSTSDV